MANSLEFKISADDQASRVVETVQNKITNFGKDIAKMALGFAGPLALVQMGFAKIGEMMDERKKKQEEINKVLQEGGISEIDNQRKAHSELNVELEKEYKQLLAIKTLREEKGQKEKDILAQRKGASLEFLMNDPTGQEMVYSQFLKNNPKGAGRNIFSNQRPVLAESMASNIDIQKQIQEVQRQRNVLAESGAKLEKSAIDSLNDSYLKAKKTAEEFGKQSQTQILTARNLKTAEENLEQIRSKRLEKAGITVSSLREMGGGVIGESSAIRGQLSEPAGKSQQEIVAEQLVEMARVDNQSSETFKAAVMDFQKIMLSMPTSQTSIAPFVNPSPTQSGN